MPSDLERLLSRPTCHSYNALNEDVKNPLISLKTCRVLVIGAGGLGCELLKDLVMTGFLNIEVIDMDTVDVSNLNRQFLFRKSDVGRPKAQVAANFIHRRFNKVNIVAHHADIKSMPMDFYRQFDIVVAGLDSVKARRWINSALISFVEYDEEENCYTNIIPIIDGGTEGLKGQSRVIIPQLTSCLECSLELFPPDPLNFQMCTLSERPRQPEHCIEYIIRKWDSYEEWKGIELDKDDPQHITWIYQAAVKRSNQFKIPGVTFKLTQSVVKRIIPALASTNSIIAASCINEALKIVTSCSKYLDNYMAYNGQDGIYINTFSYQKNPNCLICGIKKLSINVDRHLSLADFINMLKEDNNLQLVNPSISVVSNGQPQRALYFTGLLAKQTESNLHLTLEELQINPNDIFYVTDYNIISSPIEITITFTTQ